MKILDNNAPCICKFHLSGGEPACRNVTCAADVAAPPVAVLVEEKRTAERFYRLALAGGSENAVVNARNEYRAACARLALRFPTPVSISN